jgi:Tol biopolymer transport system component
MVLDLESTIPNLLTSIPASGQKQWNEGAFISYVGYEVNLTWSPDGSKLLLNVPKGDFVSSIFVINSDGSELTQLTSQQGVTDRCVSWGR